MKGPVVRGMLVRLNSGGPIMAVCGLSGDVDERETPARVLQGCVRCEWWETTATERKRHTACFALETLEVVKTDG